MRHGASYLPSTCPPCPPTLPQNVDFAPLVVRAVAYSALGGLDEGFSRSGDCGIWGDWELCNRAWMDGWQVGAGGSRGRGGIPCPSPTIEGDGNRGAEGRWLQVGPRDGWSANRGLGPEDWVGLEPGRRVGIRETAQWNHPFGLAGWRDKARPNPPM